MILTGTKTEKNLKEAFAGESQAENKYSFYASKAKKEGFVALSHIFEKIAVNEREHAKTWFKLLNGGKIKDTISNLEDCIAGEIYESTSMYIDFAKEARQEGFENIAVLFENVAKIEKEHAKLYSELLEEVKAGTVFKKEQKVTWICSKCGHEHFGDCPPDVCPVCSHSKFYFSEKK